MAFSSTIFIFIYLPIFFLIYYLTPNNVFIRNIIVVLGSLIFYSWGEPTRILIVAGSALMHYQAARIIDPTSGKPISLRRSLFIIMISFDIIILFYFKYINFVFEQINILFFQFGSSLPKVNVVLLLGISFITFHQISFLSDVFCGRSKPPRNIIDFLVYIFLFPQLIAGPIIRFHDIGAQIAHRRHSLEKFYSGLFRFGRGLAKKVLVADVVGTMADTVFSLPTSHLPTSYAWIGITAYTIQIYFDFSGYSEMAIGLGSMMGFEIPQNFNRPYISKSVTEFWQRWHITLSNWMRLYLYIPLGGNRVSAPRMYLNLWIVFLLSGFWHGASWTFLVWGAYYGFFLTVEKMWLTYVSTPILWLWLRRLLTLLIVMGGWVFFRAPTLNIAIAFFGALIGLTDGSASSTPWGWLFSQRDLVTLALALFFSTLHWEAWLEKGRQWISTRPSGGAVLSAGTIMLPGTQFLLTILLLGGAISALVSAGYTPFLYFRF